MPSEIFIRIPAEFWDFANAGPGTPLLKLLGWGAEGRVLRDLHLQMVIHAKTNFTDGHIKDYEIAWLARPTSERIVKRYIARLVEAGLIMPAGGRDYDIPAARDWPPMHRIGTRDHIPGLLRKRIYKRDGYACVRCGSAEDLTVDHEIPWSQGGPDTFENLRTYCTPCNSGKGVRT